MRFTKILLTTIGVFLILYTIVYAWNSQQQEQVALFVPEKPLEIVILPTLTEYIDEVFGANSKTAYAIMMSESEGFAKATNLNKNGSRDHGYWQINDFAHPTVSKACKEDIFCSTNYAYKLYKQRGNFTAWYGYTNGSYKKYLSP